MASAHMTDPASVPPAQRIAFQGGPGAYSHLACRKARPDLVPMPCTTFEDAYAAVSNGEAALGMIPIENSLAGRIADNHHLLPQSGLHIIGEHFERVCHTLMGLPGAKISDLKRVFSQVPALGQCRQTLRSLGLTPESFGDTAGAARHVKDLGDKSNGAIASSLAAEIYGLQILKEDMEDAAHNTTRFLIMSRDAVMPPVDQPCMTTFVFQVRNVPAALYKAMGGFATNGVNMTKLESYQLEGSFQATQFWCDIEGHPEQPSVKLALEELHFYSAEVIMLGTYPKNPFRDTVAQNGMKDGK